MIHKIRFPAERAKTVVDYISQNQQLQVQYLGKDNVEIVDGSEIVQGAVIRIRDVLYVASKPTEITGIPARYVKITPSGEDEITREFGLTATAKFVTSLDGIKWDEDYKYTDTDGSLYIFDKVAALSRGDISSEESLDNRYMTVFGDQDVRGNKTLQFTENMTWGGSSEADVDTQDLHDLDRGKMSAIDGIDSRHFIGVNAARSEIVTYQRSNSLWQGGGSWSVSDRYRLPFDIGVNARAVIATLGKDTFAIVDSVTKNLRLLHRAEDGTWSQSGTSLRLGTSSEGVRSDDGFDIAAMGRSRVAFVDGHANTLAVYTFETDALTKEMAWFLTGYKYVFGDGLHTPAISMMRYNTVALVDNIGGALTTMFYDEGVRSWQSGNSIELEKRKQRRTLRVTVRGEDDAPERYQLTSDKRLWLAGFPFPLRITQPTYPECAKISGHEELIGCPDEEAFFGRVEPALRGEEGRRRSTADRGRSVKSRGLQGRQASNGCSDSPPVFYETRPTCNAGRPPRDTRGTLRSKPADNSFTNLTKVNADENAARAAVANAERAVASAQAELDEATADVDEVTSIGEPDETILQTLFLGFLGAGAAGYTGLGFTGGGFGGGFAGGGVTGAGGGAAGAGAAIGREFYAKEALKEAQGDLELANADLGSAVAARAAAEADYQYAKQRYRDDYAAWENEERAWRTADSNYKSAIDDYNREIAVCNREEADYNSAVAIFNSERAAYSAAMRACAEASLAAGDEGGADDYFQLADEEDKKPNIGTIGFSQGASYTAAQREADERAAARATCQEELNDYCARLSLYVDLTNEYHKELREETIKVKAYWNEDGEIEIKVYRPKGQNGLPVDKEVSHIELVTAINSDSLHPQYALLRDLADTDIIVFDPVSGSNRTWRFNPVRDGSGMLLPAASSKNSENIQNPLVFGLNNTDVWVMDNRQLSVEIFRELAGWEGVEERKYVLRNDLVKTGAALTGRHIVVINAIENKIYTVTMEREIDYSPTSFDVQGGAF